MGLPFGYEKVPKLTHPDIYILSIKENPLEIPKILLSKIVTAVHFLVFWSFNPFIFHSSASYRCLILQIVAFTRVWFCRLCMCWPLLLYVVSCISFHLWCFSLCFLLFIFPHTDQVWVLFGAILMYVFLHCMLAYDFLAFLFLHAYYLFGFSLLFRCCFHVCFVTCMLFFHFALLDDVWFACLLIVFVCSCYFCCSVLLLFSCVFSYMHVSFSFFCVKRGFGFFLSLSCFSFHGGFVVNFFLARLSALLHFFAVLWHVLQTR